MLSLPLVVMSTLASSVRDEPRRIRSVSVSCRKRMPAKMLVIGSNVLRMAARCAPIKNVPFWKSTTAPTQRVREKNVKAQAEARDLTVAEMPEKQDIDGIGHTGR